MKRHKPRHIFLLLATACLFVFGNEFFAGYITNKWEYPAVPRDSVEHHDYGIVLSGMGAYHESSGSFRFYDGTDRFIQAVTLYHRGKVDTLILSGGSGRLIDNKHKEAAHLKQYLLQWGIPEKDILVESASRNTYENARNTVEKYHAPGSTYLLITSAFHMRRALACFQNEGLTPDVFPTDPNIKPSGKELIYYVLPNVHAFEKWNILLKEWVGYVVYKIMGYL
ncbi:MAG: YdcF family protein [Bacteroidales bacterium]|nr:YdcF family protein [Bacteroidales bacterium]